MKKLLFIVLLMHLFCCNAFAADISGGGRILADSGIDDTDALFDMNLLQSQAVPGGASLTLRAEEGISGLYFIFDLPYESVTLTENDRTITVDTGGILHFYLDVEKALGQLPKCLLLTFSSGEAQVNELRVFSPGALPNWVEQWNKIPQGEADLLLLSTHGDDEQLFFAGLLPWYAAQQGKRVQVVYFTDHRNITSIRVHEMLRGLWTVGVRDYPVFGAFPDYYTFDMEDAYSFYEEEGFSRETLLDFVTRQLRYYRPLVAVGHDEKGEYGHGMHQLTSDLLKKAVEASADSTRFPDSAQEYGVWQVPKTYLHLYPENQITLNWDIPMDAFGGKTAYEVTKELGFPCHESQVSDFAWYFQGADRASDVERYSPCLYGLWHSTVGADTVGDDFFENLAPVEAPTEAPTEVTTEPVPTDTAPPPDTQPSQPPRRTDDTSFLAEQSWLAIPAAGTAVLLFLTAYYKYNSHE